MPMNESTGNMYGFITNTWNPIKGCEHDCTYCYVTKMYGGSYDMKPRIDLKELETNLGSGNFIFVGSTTDMFGDFIPSNWIQRVMAHCRSYPGNRYLLQTKNPERFIELGQDLPPSAVVGTTIETNRHVNGISKAPSPEKRYQAMVTFNKYPKMVSIEPIMDMDFGKLVEWIQEINPVFVSIGADSQGCGLKEPNQATIKNLVRTLRKCTEVILKDNLKRIYQDW